jgi:predicted TIM-barrel fold metal-dependent hydrolase
MEAGASLDAHAVVSMVRPTFVSPPGAVDCHMHIYDTRVPFCAGATLPHGDATVAQYRALQSRLGLSRAVVVAPSAYGANNVVTLEAIRALGDHARGVAIVAPGVSDAELDALHAGGIRGARFNFHLSPAPTVDALTLLAARVAERGWHVQIGMRAPRLVAEAATLRALPGAIVLEHCAGIAASAAYRSDPAYPLVLDLLDTGRCWIKLSGPYLREPGGAPAYPLLRPFVSDLVARAPTRAVWGSDWPHPSETAKPGDAALLDLIPDWMTSEQDRMRILVSNPAELYDFPDFASETSPERIASCG